MHPLASGAAGLAADRLHHHFADDLADRGADPAAVHGRGRRPAVPRIRHHARGHHRHLGGRLADAGADDVRQAPAPSPPTPSAPASTCKAEQAFNGIIALYGRALDWVLDRQPLTLLVAVATLALDAAALHRDPEGIFPGAGHRHDPGHLGGVADASPIDAMAERQQAARRRHPQGPGRRQPELVHRRRRHQHDAEQRPLPDQSQAARRAQARRHRDHPPPAARSSRRRRHHALHAAGAGPHHRRHGEPRAIPLRARGRQPERVRHLGAEADGASSRQLPQITDVASDLQQQGLRARHRHRPRHRRAASASRRRPSTTRSTTPSASASSRPSTPSRTNIASSWRSTRRCSARSTAST